MNKEFKYELKESLRMEQKMNKSKGNIGVGSSKIFWGVLLILGAAALIVDKLGYLELGKIGFWSILFSACLLGTLVEGICKRRFGEILFSIAFLIIVHDELLGLEAITPWPVLGAALLGTIGLGMIFPKFGRKKHHIVINGKEIEGAYSEETRHGDKISINNVFGESVKYISGDVRKVEVENVFGSTQVYFSDAVPIDGSMRAEVEVAFGSVILYVPASWRVEVKSDNAFGNTKQVGNCNPTGENVLYVNADVAFGSLQIRYCNY